MFHTRMLLNLVFPLLLLNFVSGFRLELMYVSLMVNITSSITHLHGFQLLYLDYSTAQTVFSASDKPKLLAKKFSRNS